MPDDAERVTIPNDESAGLLSGNPKARSQPMKTVKFRKLIDVTLSAQQFCFCQIAEFFEFLQSRGIFGSQFHPFSQYG